MAYLRRCVDFADSRAFRRQGGPCGESRGRLPPSRGPSHSALSSCRRLPEARARSACSSVEVFNWTAGPSRTLMFRLLLVLLIAFAPALARAAPEVKDSALVEASRLLSLDSTRQDFAARSQNTEPHGAASVGLQRSGLATATDAQSLRNTEQKREDVRASSGSFEVADSQLHWVEKRQSASGNKRRAEQSAPQLELIVSRGTEPLSWLPNVPAIWQVTVLDRGGRESPAPKLPSGRNWAVMDMPGILSDSQAFAQFLVTRYNKLADYTIFCPADPLAANADFLRLLSSPAKLGTVQALSAISLRNISRTVADRISTRTLNSVLVHRPETVSAAVWFAKDYRLDWGVNLIKHYFDSIGLPEWMDERQEVGSYAPKAMLGFERSRALQHPKRVYDALLHSASTFGGNHLVIERLWIMLFAGTDFRDTPLL